jgi:hypothetical protein
MPIQVRPALDLAGLSADPYFGESIIRPGALMIGWYSPRQ